MDSLTYFTKTYRRYSMLLDNAVSSLDVCLILLMQCVRRLRQLAEMPHKERLKHLLTEPKQSKKNRSWVDEDWTWFKRLNWDELLLVGYNLYQAQQCVSLWGSRCSAQVAVALTIWACMAIVGDPMPQYINITNELAASFKQTHWVSTERAVEMKNFLISWSTSIPAAGLPFPKMKLPIRGGLGDGFSGYGSDRRRRIPEAEMAATAGRTIADNWRKILQARLRTRYDVLPLDEEHDMARRLFASHGPKQDDKRCVNRLTLIGNGVGSALLPLHIPVQIVSDSPRQPNRFWSASASPPAYVESATMDTPPPEKTIEDMLATRDDSSDDGYATSSDVEARTSRVAGLGLTNLGEKDEPFAFSIGLDGFNVDKPASKAIIHELSRDSSSTISPSPILTPRHRSRSPSISAIGLHSTSENERNNTELHPHAQYIKPLKRAAERRSASRSATPVASPMSTHASLPMSPSPSVDIPLRPMPDRVDIDGDHVGQLIREREQYQTYRQGNERVHGRLVSEEVEIAMKKWVEGEKRKGTIPHVISQDYLVSLGIHGDPHQMDLRPWIESMRETMPPIEALLRAGIRPTELPPHCIIHSLVHLDQQLTCYHTDDGFAPIGEDIDNAQADKELEILFRTGDEKLEDVLLPEAERKIRKEQIDDAGIWDDDDTPRRPSKSKKTEDELGQIVNAFEGEDDDGEGIQEAMLRSYCAARDGGSRGDGWSDADPSPGPEAAKVAKKSRPGRKDGGVNRRTSTKRKKAVEEEEVGSDGTVKARSKKARRQKGADSPAPANLVVGTEETIEIAAADA